MASQDTMSDEELDDDQKSFNSDEYFNLLDQADNIKTKDSIIINSNDNLSQNINYDKNVIK